MKKRGLGRSLNAILSTSAFVSPQAGSLEGGHEHQESVLKFIPIKSLKRGKYQPRREMDDTSIQELALSIKSQGILQPIIVRKEGDSFEIIAGERRWHAAKEAGLTEVPVLVKDIPDEAAMAIGLIENIQRENLNAMDEALGLQRLLEEFSLTHQEIANAIGRSRVSVSNLLRLLNLPAVVQSYLQQGDIEMGHARALLSLPPDQQLKLAELVLQKNLSVRETERAVKHYLNQGAFVDKTDAVESSELKELEKTLSYSLNYKVSIKAQNHGRGKIIIHYTSAKGYKELCEKLSKISE